MGIFRRAEREKADNADSTLSDQMDSDRFGEDGEGVTHNKSSHPFTMHRNL